MKRLASILLVVLLLLNVLSYYGLFIGLAYHNDIQLSQRLHDDRYDESETVTIRIPPL